MTILEKANDFKEDLELFETANEKMDFILDLGKNFKGLEESEKNDANLIVGCASRAWLKRDFIDGKIYLEADGESVLAKGMLTMFLSIFSNRTPSEILSFDPKTFDAFGFDALISPSRLQGMEAFLNKIYTFAKECQGE